jgi:hypothetical protein
MEMKLHFSPVRKKRIKRFFKRMPMDTGLDWEWPLITMKNR